jgi:hypothetical protein
MDRHQTDAADAIEYTTVIYPPNAAWVLRSGAPWRDRPENYGPIHDLLQSLRALATGWHLGPDHGSAGRRSCRGGADDRLSIGVQI